MLTTHDMREAQNLCNRVAIIIKGRFVAVGEPAQLMEQFHKSNLEDVFLQATGMEWKEEESEDE